MIRVLFLLLPLSFLLASDQEARDFIQGLSLPSEDEARVIFEEDLTPESQERKCSFGSIVPGLASPAVSPTTPLWVFISFSVPLEAWKEHAYDIKKTGGAFILRGLPSNSFEALAKKLLALRQAGIDASILLDPPLFEKFQIDTVPSLVLEKEGQYDKVSGNIKISHALSLFADSGKTKDLAQKLLHQLEKN